MLILGSLRRSQLAYHPGSAVCSRRELLGHLAHHLRAPRSTSRCPLHSCSMDHTNIRYMRCRNDSHPVLWDNHNCCRELGWADSRHRLGCPSCWPCTSDNHACFLYDHYSKIRRSRCAQSSFQLRGSAPQRAQIDLRQQRIH
jgi:hypothetical protein